MHKNKQFFKNIENKIQKPFYKSQCAQGKKLTSKLKNYQKIINFILICQIKYKLLENNVNQTFLDLAAKLKSKLKKTFKMYLFTNVANEHGLK